jgi:Tfp pilus assembly protein PilN
MKRDLNLMTKKPTDVKAAKSVLYIILFLVILGALYYFGTQIPATIKNGALAQKAALDSKLQELSHAKEKFEAGVKEKAQLLETVELVKELEGSKKDVTVLVDFVEKACPKEITVYSMKLSANALEVDGYADNDDQISALLIGLRKNADFSMVVANQSLYDKGKQKQDFIITATFAKPLSAEPITVPEAGAAPSGSPGAEGTAPAGTESQQPAASPAPGNS